MSYLLMIREPRGSRKSRTLQEGENAYERMVRYGADLKARGILLASESLKSDTDAVRIEIRNGKRTMVDGPFTEAKEFIGGFFLLDCQTREQAIAIASECPAVEWATVEVREVGVCYE